MRRLSHAVLVCLAGAGLAIFAATRVWSVEVTERPGLSALLSTTTGAEAQPWLIALALIALAGPGALLATRGVVRRGLGVLIVLAGAGLAVAAIAGRAGLDPGAAGAGGTAWPIAAVVGALLVIVAGLGTARYGHEWPTMGARYDRRGTPAPGSVPAGAAGSSAANGTTAGSGDDETRQSDEVDTRAVWDALDRGDDLTAR